MKNKVKYYWSIRLIKWNGEEFKDGWIYKKLQNEDVYKFCFCMLSNLKEPYKTRYDLMSGEEDMDDYDDVVLPDNSIEITEKKVLALENKWSKLAKKMETEEKKKKINKTNIIVIDSKPIVCHIVCKNEKARIKLENCISELSGVYIDREKSRLSWNE